MTPETIGFAACQNCGYEVAVKKNRSLLAYYRCGGCDFEGRHHSQKASEKFLRDKTTLREEESPEAVPAVKPAAPVPAVKPAPAAGKPATFYG